MASTVFLTDRAMVTSCGTVMQMKTVQPQSKENASKAQPRQQASAPRPQLGRMAASLLSLQRSHGNQFVQRLLQSDRLQSIQRAADPDASGPCDQPHIDTLIARSAGVGI